MCVAYSFRQKLLCCRIHRNQKQCIHTQNTPKQARRKLEDIYQEKSGEQLRRISLPTGGQPLLLYDVATLIGTIYQHSIEVSKRGKTFKNFVVSIRPLLHGLPRIREQQEDMYVNMLFDASRDLGLIEIRNDRWEEKQYYNPGNELDLEDWSHWDAHRQSRRFLTWWKTSPLWHDVWSANFQQWDTLDWNIIAARTLVLEILQKCKLEQWYCISSLLDLIWSKTPYALRPALLTVKPNTLLKNFLNIGAMCYRFSNTSFFQIQKKITLRMHNSKRTC